MKINTMFSVMATLLLVSWSKERAGKQVTFSNTRSETYSEALITDVLTNFLEDCDG